MERMASPCYKKGSTREIRRRTGANQVQISLKQRRYKVKVIFFCTSWIFEISRTRGVGICWWLGSKQKHSSKGPIQHCATPRSLKATFQCRVCSERQIDSVEKRSNQVHKYAGKDYKGCRQWNGKTNAGAGNSIVLFTFTVLLASTATLPEMVC